MSDTPELELRAATAAWLRLAAARYGADLPLAVELRTPAAEPAPAPVVQPQARSKPAQAPTSRPPMRRRPATSRQEPPSKPEAPPLPPPIELPAELEAQRERAVGCRRCGLCETRTHVVFGEGDPTADVMFVGEAPGAREDEQGRPFVGPAGRLLTKIIENAMGMPRRATYIANVNKCRPPGNRDPEPHEVAACLPFLKAQIQAIQPKVLVTLGRVAAQNLLGETRSVSRLRGAELEFEGIPVIATWHPAYLLRNPNAKRETWADIKRVNAKLGRPEVPDPFRGS